MDAVSIDPKKGPRDVHAWVEQNLTSARTTVVNRAVFESDQKVNSDRMVLFACSNHFIWEVRKENYGN